MEAIKVLDNRLQDFQQSDRIKALNHAPHIFRITLQWAIFPSLNMTWLEVIFITKNARAASRIFSFYPHARDLTEDPHARDEPSKQETSKYFCCCRRILLLYRSETRFVLRDRYSAYIIPNFSDAVSRVQLVKLAENFPRGKSCRTDDLFIV